MPFSFPYILLVFFFLTIAVVQLGLPLEERSRKYLNFIVIIVYVLFFGFRGYIATDWINYYSLFKDLSINLKTALKESSYEPGYIFYSIIIKRISTSYLFFQVVNTITNVILLSIFLNRYLPKKYFALGIAIFIAFGFIIEINLLRNSKALFIFLLSLKYIENRNWFKYYLMVLLALMFHWSSIVFIPLYFFLHKKTDIRIFIMVFVLGVSLYLFRIGYVKPIIMSFSKLLPEDICFKIIGYMGNKVFSKVYGLNIGFIERMLTSLLILFYYKKIINLKHGVLFLNSFLVYLIFNLYFNEVYIVVVRIAILFSYAYWILIPMMLMVADKKSKYLLSLFFGLLLLLKIHVSTNNVFYNYDNFLIKNTKSYKERLDFYEKHKNIIDK